MIEINGHWMDERKISYISAIRESTGGYWFSEEKHYAWCSFNFSIVVDTEFVLLEFGDKDAATEARQQVVTIRCNVNE